MRIKWGSSAVAVALAGALLAPAAGQAAVQGKTTPELIERAQERGKISRTRATLYRLYALGAPGRLPARLQGAEPYDGTLVAREVERTLPRLKPSATKARIASLRAARSTGPFGTGLSTCYVSNGPMPNTLETEHFYIEYNALTLRGGLTIADYAESLEGAWVTEVDEFDWAAPPVLESNPPPGGKYHVRVEELGPVLYGYVASGPGTHAGPVGDNPDTPWDDKDADASCMTLNTDYSSFPGSARRALDATTAHEFNHSIQFGYGALSGPKSADDIHVEGGATWMEDEVYDGADDNYNYLWPDFDDDMGEHEGSPYPYWITYRGLLERYGAGRAGGSEQVFQRFWELTSQEKAGNLGAMDAALRTRAERLPTAFHAYAINVKFNKPCTSGYRYPYCFEEGPQYVEAAGETEEHGEIASPGGSYEGSVPDNYAINWVGLPSSGKAYRVTLANTSPGGAFRGTVVCDRGNRFTFRSLSVVKARRSASAKVDPKGCEDVVAVLTNEAQTAEDPSASEERTYTLSTR